MPRSASGNSTPIPPEDDEPVACPMTALNPEDPFGSSFLGPELLPLAAPGWPAALRLGAVAVARAAAARPSGPSASSRLAFRPPRTLAGERRPLSVGCSSPPGAGNVSVYWLTAELPDGTTLCAVAPDGSEEAITIAMVSPIPSLHELMALYTEEGLKC